MLKSKWLKTVVVIVLFAATMALAAGVPEFSRVRPPMVPPEGEQLWQQIHDASRKAAAEMIRTTAEQLRYRPEDYTKGDMECMWWFSAWSFAEKIRRAQPAVLPKDFTDWLEGNWKDKCSDRGGGGPNAPTGRGWSTVQRAVLGRQDVQTSISPTHVPVHTKEGKPAERGLVEQGKAFLEEMKGRPPTPAEMAAVAAAAIAAFTTSPLWAL